MKVRLKPLTPLWLGDIDRNSAAVKESGLLGSLRFWYEGLLRRVGAQPCDPVADKECSEERQCPACRLFGATGWARRFRIEVSGLQAVPIFFSASPAVANISGNWLWNIFGGEETGGRKRRGPDGRSQFEFGAQALWSDEPFTLSFYPRPLDGEWVNPLLALILDRAAQWGGIGAKTQYGFGQVRIVDMHAYCPDREPAELLKRGVELLKAERGNYSPGDDEFSLREDRFFSRIYRVQPPRPGRLVNVGSPPPGFNDPYLPCAFDIRYKYEARNPGTGRGTDRGVRPTVRDRLGTAMADRIFGFVKGSDAHASRIHVSHLYREYGKPNYLLKVWGDVPAGVKAEIETAIDEHIRGRFGVRS